MELDLILSVLHGWFFLIIVFMCGLGVAIAKGRQTLVNLMMGMYLALFLYTNFPYLDFLTSKVAGATAEAAVSLLVFIAFSVLGLLLFSRLMPREYLESAFESIGTKVILSLLFSVLVLTLATHFLPVPALISTGTPLPEFLLQEKLSFLWLVLPLVALFFL